MKIKKILLLPLITLLMCSCLSSIKEETIERERAYTLQAVDTLSFNLDSTTHDLSFSISYFEENGNSYLSYYSGEDKSVKYFDFETKNIVNRTVITEDGANGVGKSITGVSYINADTILVSTGTYQMSIVDKDGKVKYKKNFAKPASNIREMIAEPNFQTTHQGIQIGRTLWIPVYARASASKKGGLNNAPTLYKLDLDTDSLTAVMYFPEVYRKGIYGPNFSDFYFTYNMNRKELIWSFAADESIHIYDLASGKQSSQKGESKYFSEIPSATQSIEAFEEYTKFFLLSNSYGPLYYDPYQKIYIRFAERAVSKEQYNKREWWKKRSAIILDEDFQILGEVDFSEYMNHHMGFVTKDAIYFLQAGSVEDKMTFVGFRLKKIK
jgi:WD40 repeat protein